VTGTINVAADRTPPSFVCGFAVRKQGVGKRCLLRKAVRYVLPKVSDGRFLASGGVDVA
jgi:hypothetical protein